MPFVKLDCGILNSTLWFERDCREVFITALLMAEPRELTEPSAQIEVDSLEPTGWQVPPGWYGFVEAAGIGIIHRARVDETLGREALRRLGSPEVSSRSPEFDGRRLVRVDGGYIILNYMKYRERDYTTAARSKRYRERLASHRDATQPHRDAVIKRGVTRDITQAEAEAEAEAEVKVDQVQEQTHAPTARLVKVPHPGFPEFWTAYPKRKAKADAEKAWAQMKPDLSAVLSALQWQCQQPGWLKDKGQFIPYPASWLRARSWEDEPFEAPKRETLDEQMARIAAGNGRMP